MTRQATRPRQITTAGLSAEIGEIASVSEVGEVFVLLPSDWTRPVRALVLGGALGQGECDLVRKRVLVVAIDGSMPVVVGVVEDRIREVHRNGSRADDGSVDDVRIEAAKSITLACGKASISALRNGKIVIRGSEVTTRASGASKIKGSTVKIN